jgi:hypothetical protein
MNEPRYEVFPERHRWVEDNVERERLTGQFVWHFKDANGRIPFTGGEPFTRREDAHRSIEGAVYDVVRLVIRPAHGLDLVIPIIDLDENGNVPDRMVEPDAD